MDKIRKIKKIPGIHGVMFGMMDGVINVIGIVLGLSTIGDQRILILGALAGALANSMANAAGVHVGTETSKAFAKKDVMISTLYAFLSTFTVAALVIIPHFLLAAQSAVIGSVVVSVLILGSMGIFVARYRNRNPVRIALEYISIGLLIGLITYVFSFLFTSLII